MTTTPTVLTSIVDWLKAGYPYGVPDGDYIPLLALLARRLTTEEVSEVAVELQSREDAPIHGRDIAALITQITNEPPRREDVDRVRVQLETAGPFL